MTLSYICDSFTVKNQSQYSLRFSTGTILTFPWGKVLVIDLLAPRLKNALPVELCIIIPLSTFKLRLKTYLFKVAFYLFTRYLMMVSIFLV